MRRTTADQSQGVRWTLLPTLEDQDFLDDLALVSHTHHHVHEKTSWVSTHTQRVGLKISRKETEVMMQNVSNPKLVQVNWENLPITQEFIYLGGTVIIQAKKPFSDDKKQKKPNLAPKQQKRSFERDMAWMCMIFCDQAKRFSPIQKSREQRNLAPNQKKGSFCDI